MPTSIVDRATGVYTIPAAHTNRLAAIVAGKQAAPVPIHLIVQQVMSPDCSHVYDISPLRILKLTNCEKSTRLVLCATYNAVTGTCAEGEKCQCVHADIRGSRRSCPHVNYAWRSLESVAYQRYPAGTNLVLASPSSKTVVDVVASEFVLKTKALELNRLPLSHCAHYYFNRTCNLGCDCQFVHAVFIDPTAKPNQLAPARQRAAPEPKSTTVDRHSGAPSVYQQHDEVSASSVRSDNMSPSCRASYLSDASSVSETSSEFDDRDLRAIAGPENALVAAMLYQHA